MAKKQHLDTVGELVDKLVKLPREMKVWSGVPNPGGGFEPCLRIAFVNADRKGKPGLDNCGIILDPAAPFSNTNPNYVFIANPSYKERAVGIRFSQGLGWVDKKEL